MVAEHFHISSADIKGSKRNSEIVVPRQIVMYLCRDMTATALKAIGNILGKRDHSTIIHGADKIADEVKKNDTLRNTIDVLKKKINPT